MQHRRGPGSGCRTDGSAAPPGNEAARDIWGRRTARGWSSREGGRSSTALRTAPKLLQKMTVPAALDKTPVKRPRRWICWLRHLVQKVGDPEALGHRRVKVN